MMLKSIYGTPKTEEDGRVIFEKIMAIGGQLIFPKLKYYTPNRIKGALIKTNIKRNLIPQDFEIYIVKNYNNR